MSPFQLLPGEVLEQIFAYSQNHRLGKVCRLWRSIVKDDHYAKVLLETYQKILPCSIYARLTSRLPKETPKNRVFKTALQMQYSYLPFCRNGKKTLDIIENMFPSLFSTERIQKIENYIELNEELDLHYFCMQMLNKPEIRLVEEGFREGMKLLLTTVDNSNQLDKILELRAGTAMWKLLSKHVDLELIGTLDIPSTLFSIPPQIAQLRNLRSLNLADGGIYRLPVELSQLSKLKWLQCGIATRLYIPEELWLHSNAAIHTALLRWRYSASTTTPEG